jgi:[acyl-carrier-protein] S-malonyltransferase
MLPAQERLAFDLESVSFHGLSVPLVTNVDAAPNKAANAARDSVVRQVSAPVRWLESMQLLIHEGVDTFVEVGPGKVLSGLMRQISREVKCFNVEEAASLKAASANLGVA